MPYICEIMRKITTIILLTCVFGAVCAQNADINLLRSINTGSSPFLRDLPDDYVEKPKLDEYFKTVSEEDMANVFADILKDLNDD